MNISMVDISIYDDILEYDDETIRTCFGDCGEVFEPGDPVWEIATEGAIISFCTPCLKALRATIDTPAILAALGEHIQDGN